MSGGLWLCMGDPLDLCGQNPDIIKIIIYMYMLVFISFVYLLVIATLLYILTHIQCHDLLLTPLMSIDHINYN